MKMKVLHIATVSVWLLLVVLALPEPSTTTTITTTLGVVSGTVVKHSEVNVSVFYGLPYAKPPIGNLRFKPPETAQAWTGVKEATVLPNSCWQVVDTSQNKSYSEELWLAKTNVSEDCLYLNLWIPEASTPRAVLVWIYGGGFWGGSSTLNLYNALALAAMNNVIVVSFNYRVGPFGFLYCGTAECPGNVGLLDQVLAMKWVKDNADKIGGNPAKITVFGESAGAASVGFHLVSTLSRDLFTNAVMMSGSPTVPWGIMAHEVALNRTQTIAKLLDPSLNSLSGAVTYLKTASPALLVRAQWKLGVNFFDTPFAPVIDGNFLTKHPLSLIADGQVKNTSIIIGVVKNECTYFLYYGFPSIFGNQDPNTLSSSQYDTVVDALLQPLGSNFTTDSVKNFVKAEYFESLPPWSKGSYLESCDAIGGDLFFKCPVVNFGQGYSSLVTGQVFMYSFEHRVSTMTWPKWFGVPHGYDLEIFFGLPWSEARDHYTEEERSLSADLMTRLSNFAKTGDPNTGSTTPSVIWPVYKTEEQKYLVMDVGQTRVDQGLRYMGCEFWRTSVPLFQAASAPRVPCTGSTGSNVQWRTSVLISGFILVAIVAHH